MCVLWQQTLYFIGTVLALAAVWEIYEKRVEEATLAQGALVLPDLTDGIRKAQDLSQSWDDITEAVTRAQMALDSAKTATDDANKNIEAQKTAADEAADADESLAEAQIDLAQAEGKITPQQAASQKAKAERDAEDKKTQDTIKARQAKLGEEANSAVNYDTEERREKAAALAIRHKAGLGNTPETATAAIAARETIAKSAQAIIDAGRKDLDALQTINREGLASHPLLAHSLYSKYGTGVATQAGRDKINDQILDQIHRATVSQDQAYIQEGNMTAAEKLAQLHDAAASNAAAGAVTARGDLAKDKPLVAQQNAQDAANQNTRDIASELSEAADNLRKSHEPGANLPDILADLTQVLKDLTRSHATAAQINDLQQEIDTMKQWVSRTSQAVNSPT